MPDLNRNKKIKALAHAEVKRLVSERIRDAHEIAKPIIQAEQTARAKKAADDLHAQRLEDDEYTADDYRNDPPSAEQFYSFLVNVLGYDLIRPDPHDEMCEFIAGLVGEDVTFTEDGRDYGLVLVPRDCFKSTICAVGLPLYLLVKNTNLTFIIDSYRHDVAKKRLSAIKKHIERNMRFRQLFGDWKPQFREDLWNDEAINITPRDGYDKIDVDPTFDTCGVDRPKTGSHPYMIITDDAHNRENSSSPTMRQKVLDHIDEMTPMLQPGGRYLLIGTRWAHNDAYGKIIRRDMEHVETARRDGAFAPMKAAQWRKLIRSAVFTDGTLYFPSRLTEKYLQNARKGMTEFLFRSQYFNETVESADNLFPEADKLIVHTEFYHDPFSRNSIIRWRGEDIPVLTTLAWDTAGHNPSRSSDFHGITVVGMDPASNWWILEGAGIKDAPNNVVKAVAVMILMYKPHTVSVEVVGQSGVWITLLKNYIMANNIYMPYIVENKPPNTMNKLSRIDTVLQPLKDENRMRISDNCPQLVSQMEEYPQVDHFDIIDSLAQHQNIARPSNPMDGINFTDYEYLDYEANQPQIEDPRRRLGAYAGRSSSPRRALSGRPWRP